MNISPAANDTLDAVREHDPHAVEGRRAARELGHPGTAMAPVVGPASAAMLGAVCFARGAGISRQSSIVGDRGSDFRANS